jgi:DNA helicase HerA-like ATPase
VDERFETDLRTGYPDDASGVVLGSPMLDGEVLAGVRVRLPLSTVNRHGLVAGATGTGKTKTLQVIAGQLSDAGVPAFVADVKGDLSGLAQPIDAADPKVAERASSLGWTVEPRSYPVELLSLTGEGGAPVRATVAPVLSQLGNRVQHALRAFTPKDADDLRKTARTFPITEHYDVEEALTSLGIGEALITVLTPDGVPSPLAWTRIVPPDSRMAPADATVLTELVAGSPLRVKYLAAPDRQSAHEILGERLAFRRRGRGHASPAEAARTLGLRYAPRPAALRLEASPLGAAVRTRSCPSRSHSADAAPLTAAQNRPRVNEDVVDDLRGSEQCVAISEPSPSCP